MCAGGCCYFRLSKPHSRTLWFQLPVKAGPLFYTPCTVYQLELEDRVRLKINYGQIILQYTARTEPIIGVTLNIKRTIRNV